MSAFLLLYCSGEFAAQLELHEVEPANAQAGAHEPYRKLIAQLALEITLHRLDEECL